MEVKLLVLRGVLRIKENSKRKVATSPCMTENVSIEYYVHYQRYKCETKHQYEWVSEGDQSDQTFII
jgi:hypothetical protein